MQQAKRKTLIMRDNKNLIISCASFLIALVSPWNKLLKLFLAAESGPYIFSSQLQEEKRKLEAIVSSTFSHSLTVATLIIGLRGHASFSITQTSSKIKSIYH